jgi:hypothetical protein
MRGTPDIEIAANLKKPRGWEWLECCSIWLDRSYKSKIIAKLD